ncbi:hypothetical protein G7Y79_00061g092810 [Physcia stellaris]|nr:hypothetical protein G7Y79_00061g092810 [Physcia stellaris]
MQLIKSAIAVLGFTALTTTALPTAENSIDGLLSSMSHHSNGIILLGTDGVLRSFTPEKTVHSYAQLNGAQITAFLDTYGFSHDEKFKKIMEGVDGTKVDAKGCMEPEAHMLPAGAPSHLTQRSAPTSENPALAARDELITDPGVGCQPLDCYGIGNCGQHCRHCIGSYPPVSGKCVAG